MVSLVRRARSSEDLFYLSDVLVPFVSHASCNNICMVLELFVVLDLLLDLVDLYGILPFDSVTATSEEVNELLVVEY